MAAREGTFARSVAGATLMALAACGGGGNGAKEAFVKAANAVCVRTTDRVKALGPTADQPAMIARLQQLSAIVRDEAEALRQLSAPKGDAGVVEGLLAQLELASANLAAAATAATQKDPPGTGAALSRARDNNANANTAARRYGLDRCGGKLDVVR